MSPLSFTSLYSLACLLLLLLLLPLAWASEPLTDGDGCANDLVVLRPLRSLGTVSFPAFDGDTLLVFQPCSILNVQLSDGTFVNSSLYTINTATQQTTVLVGAAASSSADNSYAIVTAGQVDPSSSAGPLTSSYNYTDVSGNQLSITFVCDPTQQEKVVEYNFIANQYFITINSTYGCAAVTSCVDSQNDIDLRPLRSIGTVRYALSADTELVFEACGVFPALVNNSVVDASLYLFNNQTQQGTILVGAPPSSTYTTFTSFVQGRYLTQYYFNDASGNRLGFNAVCDPTVDAVIFDYYTVAPPNQYYLFLNTRYACSLDSPSSSTALPPTRIGYSSSSSTAPPSPSTSCVDSQVDLRPLIRVGAVTFSLSNETEVVFQACSFLSSVNASLYLFNNATFQGTVLVGPPVSNNYAISSGFIYGNPYTTYLVTDSAGNQLNVTFGCDSFYDERIYGYEGGIPISGGAFRFYLTILSKYACPNPSSSSTALPPTRIGHTSSSFTTPPSPSTSCVDSQVDLRPLIGVGEVTFGLSNEDEIVFQACSFLSSVNASLYLFNNRTFQGTVLVGPPVSNDYAITSTLSLAPYGVPGASYLAVGTDGNLLNVTFLCGGSLETILQYGSFPLADGKQEYLLLVQSTAACPLRRSSTAEPPPTRAGFSSSSSSTSRPSPVKNVTACVNSQVDLRPLRSIGAVRYGLTAETELVFETCGVFPVLVNNQLVDVSLYVFNNRTQQGTVLVGAPTGNNPLYAIFSSTSYPDQFYTLYSLQDSTGAQLNAYFYCDPTVDTGTLSYNRVGSGNEYAVYASSRYACPFGSSSSSTALPPTRIGYSSSSSSSPFPSASSCTNSFVDLRPLIRVGEVSYSTSQNERVVFQACSVLPSVNASLYLFNNATFQGTVLVGPPVTADYVLSVSPRNHPYIPVTYLVTDSAGNQLNVTFVCDTLYDELIDAYEGGIPISGGGFLYYLTIVSKYACPTSSSSGLPPPAYTGLSSSSSSSSGASPANNPSSCVDSVVDLRPLVSVGEVSYSTSQNERVVFQACSVLPSVNASLYLFNNATFQGTVLVGPPVSTDYHLNTTTLDAYYTAFYVVTDGAGNQLNVSFVCQPYYEERFYDYQGGIPVSGGGGALLYKITIATKYACPLSSSSSTGALPPTRAGYSSSSSSSSPIPSFPSCTNSLVDLRNLRDRGPATLSLPGIPQVAFGFAVCDIARPFINNMYINATLYSYNFTSGRTVGQVLVGAPRSSEYAIYTGLQGGVYYTTYFLIDTNDNTLNVTFVCDKTQFEQLVDLQSRDNGFYGQNYSITINSRFACPAISSCTNSQINLRPLIGVGAVQYELGEQSRLVFQACGVIQSVNASLYLFNNVTFNSTVLVGAPLSADYAIYTGFIQGNPYTSYLVTDQFRNQLNVTFVCQSYEDELFYEYQGGIPISGSSGALLYRITILSKYACLSSSGSSTALPPPAYTGLSSSSSSTSAPSPASNSTGCVNSLVDLRPFRSVGPIRIGLNIDTEWVFEACGVFPVLVNNSVVDASLYLFNNQTGQGTVLVGVPNSNTSQYSIYSANRYMAQYSVQDNSGNQFNFYVECDSRDVILNYYTVKANQYSLYIGSRYACPLPSSSSSSSTALPPTRIGDSSSSSSPSPLSSTSCVDSQVDLRPLISVGEVTMNVSIDAQVVFQACSVIPFVNASLYLFNNATFNGTVLVGPPVSNDYAITSTLSLRSYQVPGASYHVTDSAGNQLNVTFVCQPYYDERFYDYQGGIPVSGGGGALLYKITIGTKYACPLSSSSSTAPLPTYTGLSSSSSSSSLAPVAPFVLPASICNNSQVNLQPLRDMPNLFYFPADGERVYYTFQPCGTVHYSTCGANSILCRFDVDSGVASSVIDYTEARGAFTRALSTDNSGGQVSSQYQIGDGDIGYTVTFVYECNYTVAGAVVTNATTDADGLPYMFFIQSAYACPVQRAGVCRNETWAVDLSPMAAVSEPMGWSASQASTYWIPVCGAVHGSASGCPANSTFCVSDDTGSRSLVDYDASLPSSLFPVVSYDNNWSEYLYVDNTPCEGSARNGKLGRSLRVTFMCSLQEGEVTNVLADHESCSYQVYVETVHACSPLLPMPQLPASQSSSSSTAGGTTGGFYASVNGHVFTTPQLVAFAAMGVVLLAVFAVCCYLIGRKRQASSDAAPLFAVEDGIAHVGMVSVPSGRRRHRHESSSSSSETGARHPSGLMGSSGAYGVL